MQWRDNKHRLWLLIFTSIFFNVNYKTTKTLKTEFFFTNSSKFAVNIYTIFKNFECPFLKRFPLGSRRWNFISSRKIFFFNIFKLLHYFHSMDNQIVSDSLLGPVKTILLLQIFSLRTCCKSRTMAFFKGEIFQKPIEFETYINVFLWCDILPNFFPSRKTVKAGFKRRFQEIKFLDVSETIESTYILHFRNWKSENRFPETPISYIFLLRLRYFYPE